MPQCSAGPSPRIFIYDIPQSLLSRPTPWRLVYDIGAWIRKSPHWERQGDCADYFFVPMHPENMVNGRMTGDASFARLYAYIRETWPYWNRTVDEGTARHFHMLPCDHGPGDCGYDRPLIPNKWSPGMHSLVQQNQRNHVVGFLNRSDANYIRRTWGGMWEQLNPSSPARLVFYLVYNGWADQLRSKVGQCRSCFHAGLDIRLPTPEGHSCGPLCGLDHKDSQQLRRQQLASHAAVGPWAARRRRRRRLQGLQGAHGVQGMQGSQHLECVGEGCMPQRGEAGEGPLANCSLFWAGAVRFHNNPERRALMRHMHQPGLCVRNTVCAELPRSCPEGEGTIGPGKMSRGGGRGNWSLATAMAAASFCFSPRGWDLGDSDRYLPAVLHGCVPVMSDRVEGMPLQEHPSFDWSRAALAVEVDSLPRVAELLRQVDGEAEEKLRAHGRAIWQRLLYTSHYFGKGLGIAPPPKRLQPLTPPPTQPQPLRRRCTYTSCCLGCSPSSPACIAAERAAAAAAAAAAAVQPRGGQAREAQFHATFGSELHLARLGLPNGTALPRDAQAAGRAACANHRSYLGEDGRSDALHTLMDILRHRLSVQPAPAEPWSCEDDWPAAEGGVDEATRVAAAAAAAPAAAAVYEKLTLRAFPDGSAVVHRSTANGPGCAVPDELGPAWFLRRFAWYSHHVTAAPGLRLRMLPAIRVATAHRRRHARPWNDTDFSAAAAATRGRRAFNPSLLQRARRVHTT